MNLPSKTIVRIALITALVMVLYELSNQLLIYHYFKFEYYTAGVALVALITGVLITKRSYQQTPNGSTENDLLTALTNKELIILALISEGKSNKEIAAVNFVEVSTVKTHINNIYGKLNVNNRKAATAYYQKRINAAKSTLSPPAVI